MADPVVYPGLASNLTLFVLSNPMARCIIWSSRGWPKTFLMNPTTKTLFNIHVFISIFRSWSWSINVFTRSARAWKSSQCITNQVEFMENFFDFFQTQNPLAVAKEKKTVAHKISVRNAFDGDFESSLRFFFQITKSQFCISKKVSFYIIAFNLNLKVYFKPFF